MPRLAFLYFTSVLLAVAATAQAAHAPDRIELKINVSSSVTLPGPITIAATAFLPDPKTLGERPIAIFALPGGGMTRHYFDLQLPGRVAYSEAEHHVAHGIVFVAIDHLGVGESSTTALDTMHIEDIAAANAAAVREIQARIRQGTLDKKFPALPGLFSVGIGQSMGGGVTIIMQGRHAPYDAIAALGYSAIHTVLPQPTEAERARVTGSPSYHNGRWVDPKTLSFATTPKFDVAHVSFWDDVPEDIQKLKSAVGDPSRATAPNWLSRTLPTCVIGMLSPGFVATEAAEIRVPVLVAVGERDVVPNPLAEPAAYQSTRDISVLVIPGLAHTHNFGTPRRFLWDRIETWARMVAAPH